MHIFMCYVYSLWWNLDLKSASGCRLCPAAILQTLCSWFHPALALVSLYRHYANLNNILNILSVTICTLNKSLHSTWRDSKFSFCPFPYRAITAKQNSIKTYYYCIKTFRLLHFLLASGLCMLHSKLTLLSPPPQRNWPAVTYVIWWTTWYRHSC